MFDEEPEGDPHGECAVEILALRRHIERLQNPINLLERDTAKDIQRVAKERDDALLQVKSIKADADQWQRQFCETNEIKDALKLELQKIRDLVAAQVNDEALWFLNVSVTEAYLQQELRKLHALIEKHVTSKGTIVVDPSGKGDAKIIQEGMDMLPPNDQTALDLMSQEQRDALEKGELLPPNDSHRRGIKCPGCRRIVPVGTEHSCVIH